jgi:hypothetical protein
MTATPFIVPKCGLAIYPRLLALTMPMLGSDMLPVLTRTEEGQIL